MNRTQRPTSGFRTQNGAATLLMATVLLMAVSMIGVYSSRSGVVEQRVAANTVWSLQTSDTGHRTFDNIAALNQTTLQTLAAGATTLVLTNDASNNSAGVVMNNAAIVPPTGMTYTATMSTTDAFHHVDMDVRTSLANGASEQRLAQRAIFGAFLKDLPKAVVTANGDATITTITNLKFSPATKNASIQPSTAGRCPRKAAILAKTQNGVKAVTTSTFTTVAVFTPLAGSTYDSLTPEQFEASFFSDSSAHLKETVPTFIKCPNSGCKNTDVIGKTGFVWVEGDLTLDGGTFGDDGAKLATAIDYGIDSNPVMFFVNGRMTLKNNAIVNGLIYSNGNWDNGNNSGTVNGAVVVNGKGNGTGTGNGPNQAGNFNSTGALVLNYEFYILQNLLREGSYIRVAGTWRDF